jgi:hypothetical protein
MDRFDQLSASELDELFEGQHPDDRPDLRPVADLAVALRARADAEPAPVMRYELRRAIADHVAPLAPSRVRRRWLGAIAASAALVAFGAVGGAGALPAPLQNAVSSAGGIVGVELPRADDAAGDAPGLPVAEVILGDSDEDETGPTAVAPPHRTPGGAAPADPDDAADAPAIPAVPPADAQDGTERDPGMAAGDRGAGGAERAEVPDAAPPPPEAPPEQPTEGKEPAEDAPSEDGQPLPGRPQLT